MKKIFTIMLVALMTLPVLGRDFTYQGLNYTVLDEEAKTCQTKAGDYIDPGNYEATGDVVIPSYANDGENDYRVVVIGEYSFCRAYGLTSVTLPNSLNTIGEHAFESCNALADVKLNESLLVIESEAFNDCQALKSITIPETVGTIKDGAFAWCTALTEFTIPASVDYFGTEVFVGCSNLKEIKVNGGNRYYKSQEGVLFDHGMARLITYPAGKTESSYKVPSSVRNIETSAFSRNNYLKIITFPNELTEIGGLAFNYCSSLASLSIPSSVKKIGNFAFQYCDGLTSVAIPASVQEIGMNPFSKCAGLTGIDVDASNASYASVGGVLFDKNIRLLISYPSGRTEASYTVPSTVEIIGEMAFYWDANIKDLKLSEKLKDIKEGAFMSCYVLESVSIPSSLVTIGNFAFDNCQSLATPINLPSTVTSIGEYAFSSCHKLPSVSLPNSITKIEKGMFNGCWELASVSIPNSVTSIGEGAFLQCTALPEITIPNSVTEIENMAFLGCSELAKVFVSSNVKELGTMAWYNCPKIMEVYYAPEDRVFVVADENTFDTDVYKNATLYMRDLDDRRAASKVEPWKNFINTGRYDFTIGIKDIETEMIVSPAQVYDLNGVQVATGTDNLPAGLYIIRKGAKTEKIVVR